MVEERLDRLRRCTGFGKLLGPHQEVLDDERDVRTREDGIGHGMSPRGRGFIRLQDFLRVRDRRRAGLPVARGFRRRGSLRDPTLRVEDLDGVDAEVEVAALSSERGLNEQDRTQAVFAAAWWVADVVSEGGPSSSRKASLDSKESRAISSNDMQAKAYWTPWASAHRSQGAWRMKGCGSEFMASSYRLTGEPVMPHNGG